MKKIKELAQIIVTIAGLLVLAGLVVMSVMASLGWRW